MANGVIFQERFYCISSCTVKPVLKHHVSLLAEGAVFQDMFCILRMPFVCLNILRTCALLFKSCFHIDISDNLEVAAQCFSKAYDVKDPSRKGSIQQSVFSKIHNKKPP